MSIYLKQLIASGEGQHLDFKFEVSDSKKLARTFSAFANSNGGIILVGVKDNGVISGVKTQEEYYMIQAASELYCKPEVKFDISQWAIDGKTVLKVDIGKSDTPPHFAKGDDGKWLAYIRVNDENFLANNIIIKVWQRKNREKGTIIRYSEKEKLLFEYLAKNESITLPEFRKAASISTKMATTIIVNLLTLEILEFIIVNKNIVYKLT